MLFSNAQSSRKMEDEVIHGVPLSKKAVKGIKTFFYFVQVFGCFFLEFFSFFLKKSRQKRKIIN
jgi:hypothetical protein